VRILGIHDGHCASAALIEDGKLIYAEQEERFTYVKNQGGFPHKVIQFINDKYDLNTIDNVVVFGNYMGYYDWSRENILNYYENSAGSKARLKELLKRSELIYSTYKKKSNRKREEILAKYFSGNLQFIDHHLAHASAAYFGYGDFENKILVITADGEGDGLCATASIGFKGKMERLISIPAKSSLGRLYSYITFLYNMVPYEHEYKIMGLAPYCTDRKRIYAAKAELYRLISFNNDNDLFWSFNGKSTSIQAAGNEIKAVFDNYRFDIIAAAVQEFTEEILIEWVKRLIKHTGIKNVVASGGVFMNVKANMLIANLDEVESFYVFPSSGDESTSIGAAYWGYFEHSGKLNEKLTHYYLSDKLHFDKEKLNELFGSYKIEFYEDIEKTLAELLSKSEIIARIKGNAEFGARALGNRSIIANPSVKGVKKEINEMIKGRDFWMPFAPSVLDEDLDVYFDVNPKIKDYEYMIFTVPSKREKAVYAEAALHPYDLTGRPQMVRKEWNPDYHRLLSYYKEFTGESLVLNTSLNLHGYPIVKTLEQAEHVFSNSGLKYMAIDNYLISK